MEVGYSKVLQKAQHKKAIELILTADIIAKEETTVKQYRKSLH